MQFEIKTTPKVKQFRFEIQIPFVKKTFRTIFQFYRSPDTWTTGYTSRCMDGKHVLFFDYDHMGLKEIRDELKYLQNYFGLSHAHIFECDRDRSYHAVILDKFPLKEAYKILEQSNVEWAYLNSVRFTRGREWVLRITEKGKRGAPKYLETIESENSIYEVSTAHKLFLKKYFGVQNLIYAKEDNITEIPLVNYNTGNRVD
jgi:hypothetical protein